VSQGPTQTVGAFHRPPTLRETLRPPLQRTQALPISRELRALQQLSVLVQDGDGIGRLVRIDADQDLRFHEPPSESPSSLYSAWRAYRLWVEPSGALRTYLCRATPPRRAPARRRPHTGQPTKRAESHDPSVPTDALETGRLQTAGPLWALIKQVGHDAPAPGRLLGDTEVSGRRVTSKAPVAHLEGGSGRSETSPTAISRVLTA